MTDATVKKTLDWAISSEAAEESVERSTTSAWSPDRTVKRHECGACKQKRTKPVYNRNGDTGWAVYHANKKR